MRVKCEGRSGEWCNKKGVTYELGSFFFCSDLKENVAPSGGASEFG